MYHKSFWWKKGRGTKASDKPEEPQYLCASGSLQNGGFAHPSRSPRLDDKNGFEGCLPSGTNPPGVPTPSPVSMKRESVSISMPSIWADISATGFLKGDETCSGGPKTYGQIIYLDDILILHQVKEELIQIVPLICQFFEALGLVINQKKSILIPQQRMEFLGFVVDATTLNLVFPAEKLRKIQQLARHLLCQQTVSVRELVRFVGKTLATQRAVWQAPLHYRALQFLINSVVLTNQSQQEGSEAKFNTNLRLTREAKADPTCMVELSGQKDSLAIPIISQTTEHDNRVRCFQYGMGSSARRASDRGEMVHRGSFTSHKLSGATSCLLALQCFAKHSHNTTILMRLDNVTAVTYINKLGGTHSLPLCQLALTI